MARSLSSSINQIAVADRFDPLERIITCAAAEAFHRQVKAGIYKKSLAADAISGRARNDVHLRLQSDANQRFVHPDLLDSWWEQIDCSLLADIVLHYFGPQVDKNKTLEEAIHAIPFIYSLGNHDDELSTYHDHKELLDLHERTNGRLSERQNLNLSRVIAKRLQPNSELALDYADLLQKDKEKNEARRLADKPPIPETPLRALERFSKCMNHVRGLIDNIARYGPVNQRVCHRFRASSGGTYQGEFSRLGPDEHPIGLLPARPEPRPPSSLSFASSLTSRASPASDLVEPRRTTNDT